MVDSIVGVLDFLGGTVSGFVGGAVLWLLDLLLSFLPASPFLGVTLDGVPAEGLGWLNWFVDVRGMVTLMGVWLACVLVYMVAHVIIKAVNDNADARRGIGDVVVKTIQG